MMLARNRILAAAAALLAVVSACGESASDANSELAAQQADSSAASSIASTTPFVTAPAALRTVPPASTSTSPSSAGSPTSTNPQDSVNDADSVTSSAAAPTTRPPRADDPDDSNDGGDGGDGTGGASNGGDENVDGERGYDGYTLVPVVEVPQPVALVAKPDTGRLYVASLSGQVWLLNPADRDSAGGGVDTGFDPQLVADIGSRISQGCENGLLGIAFSPDGSDLYLSYTDAARNTRIAVAPMVGDIPQMESRRVLLALDQPACNHNGGDLAFGPDGNLWIGIGDGGADDVFGHGQDRSSLLATIIRINPNPPSGKGYAIPSGNPFADSSGAEEVWAYGVRNPWRFSFDRLTGDLWIGDVGQNRWEEIHVLEAAAGWSAGANLGWPLFEGNERFSDGESDEANAQAPSDLQFPVYTYGHNEGCSVTGGYVYRGSTMASLAGTYVFGDYCTGELWGLLRDVDGTPLRISLGVSVPRNTLVSFGEDSEGALYALSAAGIVFRLAPDRHNTGDSTS